MHAAIRSAVLLGTIAWILVWPASACAAKAPVDGAALVKAGLMRREKGGVKLLGGGELKAKVDFAVYGASKSAVEAVVKAGGSVKILAPKKEVDEEPRGKNKRKAAADEAKASKPKAKAE